MPEQKSDADRWRELADMLGLPVEESALREPSAKPASAAPDRQVEESPVVSDGLPQEEARGEGASAWPHTEKPHTGDPHTGPREWIGTSEVAQETPMIEGESGAAPEEEDRPRRGRRRGRRGRRGRDDDHDS